MKIDVLKGRVESLRNEPSHALASFNVWEELQLFRSTAVLSEDDARENLAAYKSYAGFLVTDEHTAQTQTYISLAKMFIGNDQNLTIPNLVTKLTKAKQNRSNNTADFQGLSDVEVHGLVADLSEAKPILDRLGHLRNKVFAHLDLKKSDVELLTRGEVMQLLKLSEELLNRISVAYWGNAALFSVLDDQTKLDTQSLLELVKKEYTRLVTS